ncbi:phosphatidate cytidylyltransferase, mitochondrial-like [Clytia hemisphaerica]|eukprot:TCONS_00020669-protein
MSIVDSETKNYLSNVVSAFSPGIRYACAYGSGVFKQSGHQSIKDNMIDFIFVVNDAFSWHQQTLKKYPDHYSIVKRLGPKGLSDYQRSFGAGVFFNTCVEFDDRLIKYGIIDMEMFVDDLLEWKDLYIAGRLHKPVYTLKGLDNPLIEKPFSANLKSAVLTSIFLLDEKCSMEELFIKIASLSYTGDPRMIVGEDKGKVRNIVTPNIEKFHTLYDPILKNISNINVNNSSIIQDMDPLQRFELLQELPKNLNTLVLRNLNLNNKAKDFQKRFIDLSNEKIKESFAKAVSDIVRSSSTTQTIKNSTTAGVQKSLYYGGQKMKKMFKGLIRK